MAIEIICVKCGIPYVPGSPRSQNCGSALFINILEKSFYEIISTAQGTFLVRKDIPDVLTVLGAKKQQKCRRHR